MDTSNALVRVRRLGLWGTLSVTLLSLRCLSLLPDAWAQNQVDVTKIIWCKEGQNGPQTMQQCAESRELILQNCTSCHSFVPIVKAQKTAAEWDAMLTTHKAYVPNASADDLRKIRDYLVSHFNPQNPKPELPPELENLGINQPA